MTNCVFHYAVQRYKQFQAAKQIVLCKHVQVPVEAVLAKILVEEATYQGITLVSER